MNNENKMSGTEFGILFAVGIIAAVVGTDLAGRLLQFLYGEWPYICIGLVVIAFIGISAYVHSDFSHIQLGYQHQVDEKLEVCEARIRKLTRENENIRAEIDFIRKSVQEHWKLSEKTISKVETLLEQKSPIIMEAPVIETPPEVPVLDQSVHDAVKELVGGAI